MKRRVLLTAAAMIACASAQAHAAEPAKQPPAAFDSGKLTVLQLINIADALRQLGDYRNTKNEEVKVPFKFDAGTTMTFAIDINRADAVQALYNTQLAALKQKEVGDRLSQMAALDKSAVDEKDAALKQQKAAAADALRNAINAIGQHINDQATAMLNAPGGAVLTRIKMSELCMATKPVEPCTVTNTIPPALLAALVPIIER